MYALSLLILLLTRQVWRSLWMLYSYDNDNNDHETLLAVEQVVLRSPPSSKAQNDSSNVPTADRSERAAADPRHQEVPTWCSQYVPVGVSAAALWKQHAERILQSTALSASHLSWMQRLFVTLSPDVLEQGLTVLPWLTTLQASLAPLFRNQTLRVAVMGGSVAEGRGCDVLPPAELGQLYIMNKTEPKVDSRQCTWVHRLQRLADEFKLPVQIFNLATGGTNTFLGLPVLQYQLYHSELLQEMGGPHVLVNAYAPNDSLYSWSWNTSENNATANYDHYRKSWDAASKFIVAAATSCQQSPLVVFVNDYYGNQHDRLLGEEIRSDAVRHVAQDAGHMYLSPVTALRLWVYANTRETLFSPPWWQMRRPQERQRDAHFGMPGHIAMVWMVAYSVLRVAIEYCEQERITVKEEESLRMVPTQEESEFVTNHHLPLPLPWNTTFVEWQERMQQQKGPIRKEICSSHGPCLFAFVANPAGTHRRRAGLSKYIATYQVSNTGWQAEDDIRNGWQVRLFMLKKLSIHVGMFSLAHHCTLCYIAYSD